MALTKDIEVETMNKGFEASYLANAADTFFKGALVNLNATGKLVVASDTSGEYFAGYVTEYVKAGAADVKVRVRRDDVIKIAFSSAAQGDVGDDFFATADDTVAKTATNVSRMGICIDVDLVDDYVFIDTSKANQVAFDTTA